MWTVQGEKYPLLQGPRPVSCLLPCAASMTESPPPEMPWWVHSLIVKVELNSTEKPVPAPGMCFISGQLTHGNSQQPLQFWARSDLFVQYDLLVSLEPPEAASYRGGHGEAQLGATCCYSLSPCKALGTGSAWAHCSHPGRCLCRGWAGRKRWILSSVRKPPGRRPDTGEP